MIAAKDAQAGWQLRKAPAALIAHLVTAIFDGFLFQHFQEYVAAEWSAQKQLDHVEQLLDVALAGAGVPPSSQITRHS